MGTEDWILAARPYVSGKMSDKVAGLLAPEAIAAEVLVAEDNIVNQKLTILQLQKIGVTVHLAVNSEEAVSLAAKHDYKLI